jgi:hypothetical protein
MAMIAPAPSPTPTVSLDRVTNAHFFVDKENFLYEII